METLAKLIQMVLSAEVKRIESVIGIEGTRYYATVYSMGPENVRVDLKYAPLPPD